MIKTEDILIVSNGKEESFFLKEGYKSQEENNTVDSNREQPYWDINRIINSAWDQGDCYRYAKPYVMESKGAVMEIGSGTLVKQNRFYFSNGFKNNYYCVDQESSFAVAYQLGLLEEHVKGMSCNLEGDMTPILDYFSSRNEKISTVICFDVIEHLFNPSLMLELIKKISNKDTEIIFSTPERDLKRGKELMMSNKKEHVREWNQDEFKMFMEYFGFEVKEVKIVQDTDMREDCLTTMIFRCGLKKDV